MSLMPKFSANLGFLWPDRPLPDRIRAAANAGFKAVELHWPYDVPPADVRDACRDANVRVLALNTPVGNAQAGDFGLGAVPGREREFMEGFEQAVGYAREIGAAAIHVMAGVVPEEQRKQAAEVLASNLQLAVQRAPDFTLLLEPINPRDRPCYFYSNVEEAVAMIGRVASPNVQLMFDVYHVGVAQGDVLRRLERYLPLIGHVQIAAVPSRAEPDEGELAYGAIFSALDQFGYAGWVGCEYRPRGATDAGLRWMQTLGVSL